MKRVVLGPSALITLLIALLLWGPTLAVAQDQAATPVIPTEYEVTDLGTLGGEFSIGLGLSEAGQVVGGSTTAPGQEFGGLGTHAFLWSEGVMTDLGTLGGEVSTAQDINDAGQIAGWSETAEGTTRAVLWADGAITDLGTLGGDHSMAIRINEAGDIVGHSTTAPGQELLDPGTHAFLWSNGTMTDLGTLGSDFSRATSINEAGQVVGTSETVDGAIHPFLWQDGSMTDLGTIPGFGGGRALWINEAGSVVGFAVDPLEELLATPTAGPPVERHAWLYHEGELIDLGTLGGSSSAAFAVNDQGLVIGWSDVPVAGTPAATEEEAPTHAFVWADGVMTDLNDLTPDSELELIRNASSINNAGQTVGDAIIGEGSHAFLLTPST